MKALIPAILFCINIIYCVACHANDTSAKSIQQAIADTPRLQIDTATYASLPYWNDTIAHNGSLGYIDTFSIAGNRFRIIHQQELFDGIVEVWRNGYWYKHIEWENLGNHNDYYRDKDLDGDGYNDLIFYWKWFGEVRFFEKATGRFTDTVCCYVSYTWELLDTARNIYYEVLEGRFQQPVTSTLFTFKGHKRSDLFKLQLLFNKDEDELIIRRQILTNATGVKLSEIKPAKAVSVMNFDHEQYWKSRYKKLLNNTQTKKRH